MFCSLIGRCSVRWSWYCLLKQQRCHILVGVLGWVTSEHEPIVDIDLLNSVIVPGAIRAASKEVMWFSRTLYWHAILLLIHFLVAIHDIPVGLTISAFFSQSDCLRVSLVTRVNLFLENFLDLRVVCFFEHWFRYRSSYSHFLLNHGSSRLILVQEILTA